MDAYFAGRAAPLGRDVPAEVIHAIFYNFADSEVARHIPKVWGLVSPEAANEARLQGCVASLRRRLCGLAEDPGMARAADLLVKAGTSAATEDGRCTRQSGRCRCRLSRWLGSGMAPTFSVSTEATATTPPC